MRQVVLDPNVIVSAAISPNGATGRLLRLGLAGRFQIVVSPLLLAEIRKVFERPGLRRFFDLDAALELLASIEGAAVLHPDPSTGPAVSRDPADDYLLALSRVANVDLLVSGDRDLLAISDYDPPIVAPRFLLDELKAQGEGAQDQ